jgi:L-alanine-DL-glutamate epimerase-like enolase superfamily enzyme
MDRKSFLQKSALGYSGLVVGGLAVNPMETPSKPSDLKITDIRAVVLAANYDYSIIKIYTNQGIVGLGEVRDAGWPAQALMMKPYLIGKNPLDIEPILKSVSHLTGNGRFGGGYSAIDIALMDIAGKVLGVPCWQLLSTPRGNTFRKVHEQIACYSDTPAASNFELQNIMFKRRLDLGFQHFKMDLRPRLFDGIEGCLVGGLPTEKGLQVWGENILNIRDIIGYKVNLGADHFGRMDVNTGIALGNYMTDSKYSLAYIEDVVSFGAFNSVKINSQITAGSATPTLGFEDIYGFENFRPFIENRGVAIIHPDPLTSGGMIETKKIAEYAALFGIKTMMHNAGSPVGTMAMVHCAATIPSFISLENHALEMPWWSDIVDGIEKPLLKMGGVINVPDTPGLGIELNDEIIKKHMRESKYLPYDPGFFAPTKMFDQPISMREARMKGIIGGYKVGGPWWHYNDDNVYGNHDDPDQR